MSEIFYTVWLKMLEDWKHKEQNYSLQELRSTSRAIAMSVDNNYIQTKLLVGITLKLLSAIQEIMSLL